MATNLSQHESWCHDAMWLAVVDALAPSLQVGRGRRETFPISSEILTFSTALNAGGMGPTLKADQRFVASYQIFGFFGPFAIGLIAAIVSKKNEKDVACLIITPLRHPKTIEWVFDVFTKSTILHRRWGKLKVKLATP